MIPRTVAQELTPMLSWFPVFSVTGPRQSGKSTLIKNMLPDHTARNPSSTRRNMLRDCSRRSRSRPTNEAAWGNTCCPARKTSSWRSALGQSLAGRVGMLQLPPLSYEEAIQPEPDLTVDEFMFRGGYPHLYDVSTPNDIYFHDNGLLNYLLGIHSAEELLNNPKRGDVFENLIISETVKRYLNKNKDGELYFYRDTNQSEIDLVDATQRRSPTLIEIKSRMTPRPDFFRHLATVEEELGMPVDRRIVVYRGTENFTGKNGRYVTAERYLGR